MSKSQKKIANNPRYAEAWRLAIKGKTYKEIGAALGVSDVRAFHIIKKYREKLIPQELRDYVKDFLCDQCTLLQKELFELNDKTLPLKEKIKVIETIIKLNERLDKLHGVSTIKTDITTGGEKLNLIVTSSTGELKDEDI